MSDNLLRECHHIDIVVRMATEVYNFEIKEKGRSVWPVGLRAACGFDPGVEVVATPLGKGRALVETHEAVLEELWAGQSSDDADGVEALQQRRALEARMAVDVANRAEPAGVPAGPASEVEDFLDGLG